MGEQQQHPVGRIKGILNPSHAQNCFLNVVIQSLYHLDAFRIKFSSSIESHSHDMTSTVPSCIRCALKMVFKVYRHGISDTVLPDVLRATMSVLFEKQGRFQINEMDDAVECFEHILRCLHEDEVGSRDEGTCDTCTSHSVFGLELLEQSICRQCGASSDPMSYVSFVHYFSAAQVRDISRKTYEAQRLIYVQHEQQMQFEKLATLTERDNALSRNATANLTRYQRAKSDSGDVKRHVKALVLKIKTSLPKSKPRSVREAREISHRPSFYSRKSPQNTNLSNSGNCSRHIGNRREAFKINRRTSVGSSYNPVDIPRCLPFHAIIRLATESLESCPRDICANSSTTLNDNQSFKCGDSPLRRFLLRPPEVVSLGVVWENESASAEDIVELLNIIEPFFDLSRVFDGIESSPDTQMYLQGFIAFYGKHFVAFTMDWKENTWTCCDDALVHPVGPKWLNVVEKCRLSRFQPAVLFYTSYNGGDDDNLKTNQDGVNGELCFPSVSERQMYMKLSSSAAEYLTSKTTNARLRAATLDDMTAPPATGAMTESNQSFNVDTQRPSQSSIVTREKAIYDQQIALERLRDDKPDPPAMVATTESNQSFNVHSRRTSQSSVTSREKAIQEQQTELERLKVKLEQRKLQRVEQGDSSLIECVTPSESVADVVPVRYDIGAVTPPRYSCESFDDSKITSPEMNGSTDDLILFESPLSSIAMHLTTPEHRKRVNSMRMSWTKMPPLEKM